MHLLHLQRRLKRLRNKSTINPEAKRLNSVTTVLLNFIRMKKQVIPFLLLIIALASFKVGDGAFMKFDDAKHNFGFIHQGDVVSHEYSFTNTGGSPLIISDCEVACECTKVEFPKAPIAKGQSGKIKVTFESKSAIDRQERTVIVKSNATNGPVTLTFKCVVLKPKN